MPGWRLDHDDVGAIIGQQHGGDGPRAGSPNVDDAQILERTLHGSRLAKPGAEGERKADSARRQWEVWLEVALFEPKPPGVGPGRRS